MRTTLNLDAPVLQRLKALQRKEKKPLGRLASDLLLEAMASRRNPVEPSVSAFRWTSRSMEARVDPGDREAVYDLMDEGPG